MAETCLERIASWVAGVRREDVPPRVLELARHQALSVLAGVRDGSASEEASAVRRAVLGWGKSGRSTVFPSGERTGVHEAILANAAASIVYDHDDYLYLGHTGHSAVLAALALGEDLGSSSGEVLLAQVVANEVGGRIGASATLGPQNGQAWSFLHAAAAAALASKLLGLDAARTAHAMAIALFQPPFTLWPGFMGPGSKVLTAGWPAAAGVQAACFAAQGLTGALDVLEHPRQGFWASMTYVPLPHLVSGFGRAWVSDALAFKPYPGCAYLDTTLDALFRIRDDFRAARGRDLAPADVESIRVDASLLTIEMDNLSASLGGRDVLSPSFVNFSIPASVAIAVLAGRLGAAELSPGFLAANGAAIRDLAGRVSLGHDWPLTFRTADALDEVLGGSGIAASLGLADWLAVLSGYRRRFGGPKPHSPRVGRLLFRHPLLLGRRALRLLSPSRRRRERDLSSVDFSRFRTVFPSRVALVTRDGARFESSQEVPRGASGDPARLDVVRARFAASIDRPEALETLLAFEAHPLDRIVRAGCTEAPPRAGAKERVVGEVLEALRAVGEAGRERG